MTFLSGCAGNKIITKYKTYKFNEYIRLKTTLFKPFQDNVSFKAKIVLTLSNGKHYKFYALIYNKKNIHRIFAYSFFGKRIIDIFFGVKSFIVVGGKPELYIVLPNKIDEKSSLFWFFREILEGIDINDSRLLNDCLTGKYKGFVVRSCKEDNFKKVFMLKGSKVIRSFEINDDENGFPGKISILTGGNKLEILYKSLLKPKDFKKEFFDYTKSFKVLYLKNMKAVEDAILK